MKKRSRERPGNFTSSSSRYVLSYLRARISSRTVPSLKMNKILFQKDRKSKTCKFTQCCRDKVNRAGISLILGSKEHVVVSKGHDLQGFSDIKIRFATLREHSDKSVRACTRTMFLPQCTSHRHPFHGCISRYSFKPIPETTPFSRSPPFPRGPHHSLPIFVGSGSRPGLCPKCSFLWSPHDPFPPHFAAHCLLWAEWAGSLQ